MIVISVPRCGGSIFTWNLALKYNLIFAGETKSVYIKDYLVTHCPEKPFIHELPNQPLFDQEMWIDTIINPHKYAILVNHRDSHMLLPRADFLLLRRNFNNIIGSWLKYTKLSESYFNFEIPVNSIKIDVYNIMHNIYAICMWSKKTGQPVTWYEDHYQTPDYELTDELNKYVSLIKKTSLEKLFIECGGLPPQFK